MIVRTWKARSTPELLPRYVEQVIAVVVPYLRSFEGFRGAHFAKREIDGGLEILVMTYWESMAALRGFASDGGDHSHVPPEIASTLTSFDDSSDHYETVVSLDPSR